MTSATASTVTGAVTGAATGARDESDAVADRRDERAGRRDERAGRRDEPRLRRCIRCGAVGTHYLTCPDLRLPSGFRLAREHERT
jgi:hypothetical protein